MYLRVTGFLPDSDDSLQYRKVVEKHLESDILVIVGWSSLEDGLRYEVELSKEQARLVSEILHEPKIERLMLFVGVHTYFPYVSLL